MSLTSTGEPPPRRRGWRRALRSLALAPAAAAAALLVLYAVSRALARRTDYDWFHAGSGLLGLAGLGAMVAVFVWSCAMFLRWLVTDHGRTRFLLATCCGVFGAASLAVGIVTYGPPAERSRDAAIWAGYRSTRDGVTAVQADWTVPQVRPLGRRPNYVSAWVGLDDAERHLEQIGIAASCQRHTHADSWAWYEDFPAAAIGIRLSVRPGDTIGATVVRLAADRFRLTLSDVTTGRRFSTVRVVGHVGNTHGVIVVEESNYRDEVLAGFSPIRFTECSFDGRPITDFPLDTFAIENDGDDAPETVTSPVAGRGTSFTVARRQP